MADELHEVKTRVSKRTRSLIHALEFSTGQSMAALLRPVIDEWAEREIDKAKLVLAVLGVNGDGGPPPPMEGACDGT